MLTLNLSKSTRNIALTTGLLSCILLSNVLYAQEILSNENIISLTTAKVAKNLIVDKIKSGTGNFDMSAAGLVELKKAKVVDGVMEEMMLATNPMPLVRNEDIITMHQGGVSKGVIIKKIQYSETKFDLNTDALIALKTAKIPDPIVTVMMEPKKAAKMDKGNPNLIAGELPPHPQDLPIPARGKFAEPGVYYEEYAPKTSYTQLEPTTTNQTRKGTVGEGFANHYTGGITGTTERVGLANPTANSVIKDNRPVFYLVFSGSNRKDMNEVAENIFQGVASPNDFVLMRAKVSGRGREIIIGRQSSFTSETGFGEGAVPFRFKKISNQLYKVYFDNDVAAGEYAFYYNKGSEFSSSLKLYDFSLQNNTKASK